MKKIVSFMLGPIIICLTLFSNACVPYHLVTSGIPCFIPYKNFSFKICDNFEFTVDGKKFVIPKGFVTDFASIPRIFWNIYSPNDADTVRAAIIHDYLYTRAAGVDREYADSVFYNLLMDDGVAQTKSTLFWANLRLFGWAAFQQT